jgi:hydrogenase expression/formation protein HypC
MSSRRARLTDPHRNDLPLLPSQQPTPPRAIDLEALFDDYEAGACSLDQDGCLTCGDVAVPVTVRQAGDLDAVCVDAYGQEGRVAIDLVAPVAAGDRLLVHAGVAIEKLEPSDG